MTKTLALIVALGFAAPAFAADDAAKLDSKTTVSTTETAKTASSEELAPAAGVKIDASKTVKTETKVEKKDAAH